MFLILRKKQEALTALGYSAADALRAVNIRNYRRYERRGFIKTGIKKHVLNKEEKS